MTTQLETTYAVSQWTVVFKTPPGTVVKIDSRGLDEFTFRCTVEGTTVEEARANMAALKAELQRVLDL